MKTISQVDKLSVFLSYAHADKSIAKSLARALRSAGLRVWIDEGELRAGDSIIARIASALSEVEFVVALVSKHSVGSKWCNKELSLAVNEGLRQGTVRVLPLRLDQIEMPPSLQDVLYLQLDSTKALSQRLIKRLISDVHSHRRELQDRLERPRFRVEPLLAVSSINPGQLKKLRSDLSNKKLADDWDLGELRDILVRDYSIPATDALFEAAIDDGRRRERLGLGYASYGLVLLLPTSIPWIRRLLAHRNGKVVSDIVGTLVEDMYLTHRDQISAFCAIKALGNWPFLKRNMLGALKKTGSSFLTSKLRDVLMDVDSQKSSTVNG